MNRANDIQRRIVEALASPASTQAANKVLKAVKEWNALSIGAQALSLRVQLPEAYVAKILSIIARQGFLSPMQYENVYKFHGARLPIRYAAYIDDNGIIMRTREGVDASHFDPWGLVHHNA